MGFELVTIGTNSSSLLALRFVGAWLRGQKQFVLHTSGSTGAPKALTFSRVQLEASARATGAALGYQAGQTALLCLSPGVVGGLMVLVRGLVFGWRVVVVAPSRNPLNSLPATIQIDHLSLAPLQVEGWLEGAPPLALQKAQTVLVGGSSLPPRAVNWLAQVNGPAIYHTFGMTETLSHIALKRLNGTHPSQVYMPLPGVTIGQNEAGCLWIESSIVEHRIQTHDVVTLTDGGFIFLGRADFVINSGGVKIHPEQVEAIAATALLEHGRMGKVALTGVPDLVLGTRAELVVEGAPLPDEVATYVSQSVSQALGRYLAPKAYHAVEKLPQLPSGKLDRLTLATWFN